MWCVSCYTLEEKHLFHVASQVTLGTLHKKGREEHQYKERLNVAWKKEHPKEQDFHEAGHGDHLLTPVEFDLCIYRKLRGVDPLHIMSQDQLLLSCIRCMHLDSFYSRARIMVAHRTRKASAMIQSSRLMGMYGPFEHEGPYPSRDHCCYEVASNILLQSRNTGRHDPTHSQFETIRKLRYVYGNQVS